MERLRVGWLCAIAVAIGAAAIAAVAMRVSLLVPSAMMSASSYDVAFTLHGAIATAAVLAVVQTGAMWHGTLDLGARAFGAAALAAWLVALALCIHGELADRGSGRRIGSG